MSQIIYTLYGFKLFKFVLNYLFYYTLINQTETEKNVSDDVF